ncbi:MAG: hypothetical protein JXA73_25960 [Acidobacteria bacterium]|nr:hypothetical protein [Acidobacteriota bacterium]
MTDDSLLGQLAEEFTQKVRAGKLPDEEETLILRPEPGGEERPWPIKSLSR